jgi:hypothetical protein
MMSISQAAASLPSAADSITAGFQSSILNSS